MLFLRKTTRQASPPQVTINNVHITRVHVTKFLGVILNEKLSWSNQIKALEKGKMARYIRIMYRIRSHIPFQTSVQIYIVLHNLISNSAL